MPQHQREGMMKLLLYILWVSMLMLAPAMTPAEAAAECNIKAGGEVNVISSQFPVLEVLAKTMRSCERSEQPIGEAY